jgi:hypothetical protein
MESPPRMVYEKKLIRNSKIIAQNKTQLDAETNGSIEVCKLYNLAPLQHMKRGNKVKLPCKENPKLPISSTMMN